MSQQRFQSLLQRENPDRAAISKPLSLLARVGPLRPCPGPLRSRFGSLSKQPASPRTMPSRSRLANFGCGCGFIACVCSQVGCEPGQFRCDPGLVRPRPAQRCMQLVKKRPDQTSIDRYSAQDDCVTCRNSAGIPKVAAKQGWSAREWRLVCGETGSVRGGTGLDRNAQSPGRSG